CARGPPTEGGDYSGGALSRW
nr:immunoglobulin heavy chain junction region [Macaca mulatta]MOX61796.1 immunoglobulin heavy chain junction region [Macaca mulatta]MOX62228.1 immunoglobulin heavy chain junction region [Macaca mulatta]MOX63270.1 immunoglobulin heavy chain junction region [Macaca mulatta]MOX63316.1 immunoglobulin heavy chain junction region [Macaca mulatta]